MRLDVVRTGLCTLTLGVAALAGCSSDTGSDSADVTQADTTCSAAYRTLQKDAYKSTAGRSSELWPPHTTTTYEVACATGQQAPQVVQSAVMANHGTRPDAVDESGEVILVEVDSLAVHGTRQELTALGQAFEQCSCDAATTFLSLDALQDEGIALLVEELGAVLGSVLTCPGEGGTAALIALLKQGAIETAVQTLPTCIWADGADLEGALDQALSQVLAAGDALAGYHVCNNDAQLQAELVATFVATGEVKACDATSPLCQGPTWLYTP